jgi:prepilin-type N-terminal cleavage/methylation domain-containing protein/prepilin-type processing-associated H-X9-DG protein
MVKSSPRLLKRAFTLIELLITVAIMFILAAIAVPAFAAVLERAKATKDASNLRQIGMAIQTYLNDNDQILPVTDIWPGTNAMPVLYPKYVQTRKVFQSPFDKRASSEANDETPPISYSINTNMYVKLGTNPNMLKVASPASTFLMAPNYPSGSGDPGNTASWPGIAGNAPDLPFGGGGETKGTHISGRQINVLFCDFHTETLTFGPAATPGTFQDQMTDPLGQKHWDPTK